MILQNIRFKFTKNSTTGKLFIDNAFSGIYILEPTDMGLEDSMTLAQIMAVKNPRLAVTPKKYTAIPSGTYDLRMVPVAPAFLAHYPYFIQTKVYQLPEVQNIKDYSSVLFHIGNFENAVKQDSEACQIVGNTMAEDAVYGSGQAFEILKTKFPTIAAGGVKYTISRDAQAWLAWQGNNSNQ